MSEQILLQPIQAANTDKAKESLEKARIAHERYLIRQQNSDLQEAIEYYIDAVKYDPSMPEAYYRLATLMWEQGQISIDTAIEQCKTAVSLAPHNINAHLYTGFFMKMAQDFKSAEQEFKSAIKMGKLKSARPRLILSQSILQKINSQNGNVKDYLSFIYYFLSGSLMLAWDRPSMKMFYKNMSDDFSVFTYNTVGKFLEKFKLYPTAESIYRQAITATNHSEIFYNKMGDLALKNKETDLTVDCYRKVLEANPLNREVLIKLATVLQTYFPENTDETIDCYEKLLEFDIDTPQIYYELGHLYMKKEDKINSISAFKLALERDPENPFYNNSTHWYRQNYRTAGVVNANLQASGGSENVRYMVGAGYYDEKGIAINTDFKRFNVLSNLTAHPAKRLRMDTQLGLTYSDRSRGTSAGAGGSKFEGSSSEAKTTSTLLPGGGASGDLIIQKYNEIS